MEPHDYRRLPFGNPEGENFDLSEAVDLGESLSLPDGGLQVRAFVGWKGAGKTLYLKLHHEAALTKSGVDGFYVEPSYAYRQPTTDAVVEFTARGTRSAAVERWQVAWKRSALLAAMSHLTFAPALREHLPSHDEIPSELVRLLRWCGGAVGLYDAFAILNQYDPSTSSRGPLDSAMWNRLVPFIGEALGSAPPISLYADMLDAGFEVDPGSWTSSQLGLLLAIASMVEDPEVGGRLHVTVTLRDHTLALLSKSVHATKIAFQPYVKSLEWDYESLRQLLVHRLETMDHRFLSDASLVRRDPVRAWLGFNTVTNTARNVTESAVGYLLRHTRLIPRDLVVIGNAVCARTDTTQESRGFTPAVFKRVISDCARRFGQEQIAICAQHIAADAFNRQSQHGSLEDSFWATTTYKGEVAMVIESTLSRIGIDRFSAESLTQMSEMFSEADLNPQLVLSALWVNRMLGIVEVDPVDHRARTYFFGREHATMHLPDSAREFVLHPCLIDALPALRGEGPEPVVLGRGWDRI